MNNNRVQVESMTTVLDSQYRSHPLSSLNEHSHRIQQFCIEERGDPEKVGRKKETSSLGFYPFFINEQTNSNLIYKGKKFTPSV